MGSTQVKTAQAQMFTFWQVRRATIHRLVLSLGCVAWIHLSADPAFGQATGTAASENFGKPAAEALIRPTLKPGSRGAEVTELQATLKLLGYYGGTVDGFYGQNTVSAVSQFQQAAGLTADGITGPATWNRLFPAATEGAGVVPTPNASSTASVLPAVNGTAVSPAANSAASFPVPSGVTPAPQGDKPSATSPRPAVSPAPSTTAPKPIKPATETRPATTGTSTTESATLPILRQGMKGSAVMALQQRLRSLGVFKGVADGVFGAETLAAVKVAQRNLKLLPDGVVGAATWNALLR